MAQLNAAKLLSRLARLVDNQPNTIASREGRLEALNSYYMDVSHSHDWLFLEQTSDWKVWYGRTGTNTTYTAAVTNGSYTVYLSGQIGLPWEGANPGQPFWDTESADTATVYTINRITGLGATILQLDRPYEGATGTLTTWTIPGSRFYLPTDCARALRFIDEKILFGPLVILDRRRAEDRLSWINATDTGSVYWMVDGDAVYDQPPDPGMSLSDDTTGGTLPAGSTWEICYTFVLQGRESPPSVPVQITLGSAAAHRIQVTGIIDTSDGILVTGITKKWYVRQLTKSAATTFYGRWLFIGDLAEGTTTATLSATTQLLRAFPLVWQNGRQWMGTKYPPSQDQTLRLRYLRKVAPLVADSDVPNWPDEYHEAIAYGAAIDIFIQAGLQNKIPDIEKLRDAKVNAMKGNHLITPGSPTRREMGGMGDRPGVQPVWMTTGPVTGDFSAS